MPFATLILSVCEPVPRSGEAHTTRLVVAWVVLRLTLTGALESTSTVALPRPGAVGATHATCVPLKPVITKLPAVRERRKLPLYALALATVFQTPDSGTQARLLL